MLGIKKIMTSGYDARGRRVGATRIEISPNFITQVKTTEGKDGYAAVQLGMGSKKSVNKSQIGHLKKANISQSIRWLREVRATDLGEAKNLEPGTQLKVTQVFSVGDAVKVSGVSKGKGFQGGVRRHGFHGGPKTHGQSDRHRAPGSIGQTTTPGRVYKGKRMAGHMGVDMVTTRNLEVIAISPETNLITVKGSVPGHSGTLLTITKLGRIKGYVPPPEEKEEEIQKDSENSENQSVGESDKSELSDQSDNTGAQSNSESSEKEEIGDEDAS